MKKKLVMGTMIIAMVSGLLTGGAFAAFADIETSGDSTFTAGTLDLKTDGADGVTQTLYAAGPKLGESIGPATIVLKNAGSVDGGTLDVAVSYVESDDETADNDPSFAYAVVNNPAYEKTADETAAVLEVNTLDYGGSSLLGSVADWNSNTYKDVEDLKHASLSGLSGINSLQTKDFVVEVTLRNDIGNEFQADGVDINFTFTLNQ